MNKIMMLTFGMVAFALAFVICPVDVMAEEKKAFSVRATGKYTSDADVGDGDGSMSMTSERVDVNWKLLSLSYTQTQFSWDNTGELSFGNGSDKPWERLHRLALGANYRGDINEQWFYHTGLTFTSAFEKEMSDSYGTAVRGGFGYKWSDQITIMGGVAVMHNSLRTAIMPNAAVSYNGLDDTGAGWSGRLGLPATEMGYHFNETSALRASLGMNGETARLADDSTVEKEGYVKTSGWQTALYYDWKASENISLSFGPEYSFGRSISIYNSDGDEVTDEDVDSALGGSLRFRVKF